MSLQSLSSQLCSVCHTLYAFRSLLACHVLTCVNMENSSSMAHSHFSVTIPMLYLFDERSKKCAFASMNIAHLHHIHVGTQIASIYVTNFSASSKSLKSHKPHSFFLSLSLSLTLPVQPIILFSIHRDYCFPRHLNLTRILPIIPSTQPQMCWKISYN